MLQQSELAGFGDGFGASFDAELTEDVAVVSFDGADGDKEPLADLLVGEAVGDQGEDFELALAQGFEQGLFVGGGHPGGGLLSTGGQEHIEVGSGLDVFGLELAQELDHGGAFIGEQPDESFGGRALYGLCQERAGQGCLVEGVMGEDLEHQQLDHAAPPVAICCGLLQPVEEAHDEPASGEPVAAR